MASAPPSSPPTLEPPFRGYIETTYDALLVFEAARRGMIPRVTRRLIERERGMVQSGAVFVFDEHESGIKRWTDGLVWSPSRILGNFLVYRETDKRPNPPSGPISSNLSPSSQNRNAQLNDSAASITPPNHASNLPSSHSGDIPPLGQGALRPRSASDGGNMDRQRERQLVGSLTNSYKFKDRGLVKKTMSVTVNGFAQHMISYYSIDDVVAGKLRSPSTVPELASLEISPEYLHKQNFRFPPMVEVGPDGIPRYRGEPEEPTSPTTMHNMGLYPQTGDMFDYSAGVPNQTPQGLRLETVPGSSRNRSMAIPMAIPLPSPSQSISSYAPPGSAGSGYFEQMSPMGSSHMRPGTANGATGGGSGPIRPESSRGRYDPYTAASPRSNAAPLQHQQQQPPQQHLHQGQPQHTLPPLHTPAGQSSRRFSGTQPEGYYPYDVKPAAGPNGHYQYAHATPEYGYYGGQSSSGGNSGGAPSQPMSSPIQAPSTFPHSGGYAPWQQTPPSATRGMNSVPRGTGNSPVTSSSIGGGGGGGAASDLAPPSLPNPALSNPSSSTGPSVTSSPNQHGINGYPGSQQPLPPPPPGWPAAANHGHTSGWDAPGGGNSGYEAGSQGYGVSADWRGGASSLAR